MKTWIKFLIMPWTTIVIFSFLEWLVMGFLFNTNPNGWGSWISGFVVMWFVGSTVYFSAPTPKLPLSTLYTALLFGLFVFVDYSNSGQTTTVFGETVRHQFNLGRHIASALGLFISVAGMHYAETEDTQSTESSTT